MDITKMCLAKKHLEKKQENLQKQFQTDLMAMSYAW